MPVTQGVRYIVVGFVNVASPRVDSPASDNEVRNDFLVVSRSLPSPARTIGASANDDLERPCRLPYDGTACGLAMAAIPVVPDVLDEIPPDLGGNDADEWIRAGDEMASQCALAAAVECYSNAAVLAPADGEAWARKAYALQRLGRTSEAVESLCSAACCEADGSLSCLHAAFVKDVTIDDGTIVRQRSVFTKTWRLQVNMRVHGGLKNMNM
jgi:hypothetical protein